MGFFFLALMYFTVHSTTLGREPTQNNLCYSYSELSWRDWCFRHRLGSRPFQEVLKVQLFSVDKMQPVAFVQFTAVWGRRDTGKELACSSDGSCIWRQITRPTFKLCRTFEAWFLSFHSQFEACWEWLSVVCFAVFVPVCFSDSLHDSTCFYFQFRVTRGILYLCMCLLHIVLYVM